MEPLIVCPLLCDSGWRLSVSLCKLDTFIGKPIEPRTGLHLTLQSIHNYFCGWSLRRFFVLCMIFYFLTLLDIFIPIGYDLFALSKKNLIERFYKIYVDVI